EFLGGPDFSYLQGSGYLAYATGFKRVQAFATPGKGDAASVVDSTGDDTFAGQGNAGTLTGPGYSVKVTNFDLVNAYSSAGGTDRLQVGVTDYVFQEFGNWQP